MEGTLWLVASRAWKVCPEPSIIISLTGSKSAAADERDAMSAKKVGKYIDTLFYTRRRNENGKKICLGTLDRIGRGEGGIALHD